MKYVKQDMIEPLGFLWKMYASYTQFKCRFLQCLMKHASGFLFPAKTVGCCRHSYTCSYHESHSTYLTLVQATHCLSNMADDQSPCPAVLSQC